MLKEWAESASGVSSEEKQLIWFVNDGPLFIMKTRNMAAAAHLVRFEWGKQILLKGCRK